MQLQRAVAPSAAARASSRGRLVVLAKESRIGSKPIPIPKGVTVDLKGDLLRVKGPNGELSLQLTPFVVLEQVEGKIVVKRAEQTKKAMAMHGLSRSLAANMVTGVTTGFTRRMEMVGTGYRASATAAELTLNVGYSKPRILAVPKGLKVVVEKSTTLIVSGADKVQVGAFCAEVRRQRPPEPYKGKGIRDEGEVIKLKEGKKGKK